MTGRKGKYTPENIQKVCKAIAQGKTDKDACKTINITTKTYYDWLQKKSEFCNAIKNAKREYEDWQNTELVKDAKKSLKELICGYTQTTTKTRKYKNAQGVWQEETTTEVKKMPPSSTAIIFALCNRDPEHWQNRISNEIAGKIETEAKQTVSLANVPDELLGQLIDCIQNK